MTRTFVKRFASRLIRPGQVPGVYAGIIHVGSSPYVQNILLPHENGHLQSIPILERDCGHNDSTLASMVSEGQVENIAVDNSLVNAAVFDAEIWHSFLPSLHPTIAKNFALDDMRNRYLIYFYNYCLFHSATTINAKDVIQNRSASLAMFPLLQQIVSSPYQKFAKTKEAIDSKSPADVLKIYFQHPVWATDGFLRRASHTNSLDGVENLGKVLSSASCTKNGSFSDKRWGEIVSVIPHSRANLDAFELRAGHAEYLSAILSVRAAANIFLNTRKWGRDIITPDTAITLAEDIGYKGKRFYDVRDYLRNITTDIALPLYLKKYPVVDFDANDPKYADELISKIYPAVERNISSLLDLNRMYGYVDRMWRNRGVIGASKAVLAEELLKSGKKAKSFWYPIIQNMEIGECSLRALTNQDDLLDESKVMNHCARGYAQECSSGKYHMISGIWKNGEHFSLYLSEVSNGAFVINQLVSASNGGTSTQTKELVDMMIKKMNSGDIAVNDNRGNISKDEGLYSRLGFDPYNQEHIERIYLAYRGARILPSVIRKINIDEMTKFLLGGVRDVGVKSATAQALSAPNHSYRECP